jgi:hypothetical protein
MVGDRVFLRVKPHKSSIKFGKGDKISPRFVGHFEVVERKGPVAYRLTFPNSLSHMHDVFHVFVLQQYISDLSDVFEMISLQVLDEDSPMVEPIYILDHHIQ